MQHAVHFINTIGTVVCVYERWCGRSGHGLGSRVTKANGNTIISSRALAAPAATTVPKRNKDDAPVSRE